MALLFASSLLQLVAQTICREVQRFHAENAVQGVAVDGKYFYAIQNTRISKYTIHGDSITTWTEPGSQSIFHLNSGVVIGHKMYCAHSNYPRVPMASSIEIFDTRTMQHLETVSLGIDVGSCTWVVPGKKCWYVFFAHYDKKADELDKDASWAQLVQYDRKWRRLRAWILPPALVKEVRPNSLSGGIYMNDTFYCTGHDAGKCYLLRIPSIGMMLEWNSTIEVPFEGQGLAVDPKGNLWGIERRNKTVIKSILE